MSIQPFGARHSRRLVGARRLGPHSIVIMAKKKKPQIVPRRGPATNLRKAGVHDDKKSKALERLQNRERELDDLFLGRWAFEEDE